jgi:hypothetical protein
MATDIVVLLVFLGGFTGWALFVLTMLQSSFNHRKQLGMVKEITYDLKKVKQELHELK